MPISAAVQPSYVSQFAEVKRASFSIQNWETFLDDTETSSLYGSNKKNFLI